MGCVIKYKGQSIPEEQFLQYLNKQIAINNLFNENESLANQIYETLGFKQNITKNLVKSKHDTDEYRFSIGDFIKEKNSVRVTKNKEGDFSIHEGDLSELTKQQKIALFQEQSNVIPIGGQIVQRGASSFDGIRHRINLKNHGFSIEYGTDNLQEYKSTNKKEVQEFSNLHNLGKVIEKDGKLFTKGVILTKEKNIDQITPQQKQQAISKFQEYVNTTGKQDIQGFKDFVQSKQFQKLTAEEKAKTIEQVTKEQNNSLFGLNTQNQEQLEFHINTLNVVSKFLENAGIETRLVSEFLSQDVVYC